MENGTAQAKEKCGHASERRGFVWDEASGVECYKRMEARILPDEEFDLQV